MDQLLQILHFIAETKKNRPEETRDSLVPLLRERFHLKQEGAALLIDPTFALKLVQVPKDSDHAPSGYVVLSLKRLQRLDDRPVVACAVGPKKVRFALVNSTMVQSVSTGASDLSETRVRGSFYFRDVRSQFENLTNHPNHFQALFSKHQDHCWEENLKRIARNTHSVTTWRRLFSPNEQQRASIFTAPERLLDFLEAGVLDRLQAEYDAAVEASQEALQEAYNLPRVSRARRVRELLGCHQLVGTERTKRADRLAWVEGFYVALDVKTKEIEGTSNQGVGAPIYYFDKLFEHLAHPDTVHLLLFVRRPRGGGKVRCKLVPTLADRLRRSVRLTHNPKFLHGFATVTHKSWIHVFDDEYVPQVDGIEAKYFLLAALDRKQPNPKARKRRSGSVRLTSNQAAIILRAVEAGGKIEFAIRGGACTTDSLLRKKMIEDGEGEYGDCYQLTPQAWDWYRGRTVDSKEAAG